MSHLHLSSTERETIAILLQKGWNHTQIGQALNRHHSTISREIKRHSLAGHYAVIHAHEQARAQRHKARKPWRLQAQPTDPLWVKVRPKLKRKWSPAQIARWLKMTYPTQTQWHVSAPSIYRAIYVLPKGSLKKTLIGELRREGQPRKSAHTPKNKPWVTQLVHARPVEVAQRLRLGDLEADLVLGPSSSRAALLVVYDRTSRRVWLRGLASRDAYTTYQALSQLFQHLPASTRRTLTYDQGSEMAEHTRLTHRWAIPVFFCDPHSPWQRGGCENINGLIRQYFPKGVDFSTISQPRLNYVAKELNERPRATLHYRCPKQVWNAMLAGLPFEQAVSISITDFMTKK